MENIDVEKFGFVLSKEINEMRTTIKVYKFTNMPLCNTEDYLELWFVTASDLETATICLDHYNFSKRKKDYHKSVYFDRFEISTQAEFDFLITKCRIGNMFLYSNKAA